MNYREIADEYGVTVTEVKSGDDLCKANGENSYENSSYCAGKDVYLGIYSDNRLKDISFFHELGHILGRLPDNYWKLLVRDIEKLAWKEGIRVAKAHGFYFTISDLRWAVKQITSYDGWEERESTNFQRPTNEFRFKIMKQYEGKDWKRNSRC